MTSGSSNRFNWHGKLWKQLVSSGKDNDSLDKMTITPLYQRLPHVLSLGGFITVTIRLRFSAASWEPKPTARKNAKRYYGNMCLGDNCHSSFRHHKGTLNLLLVVARKNLNRRSKILGRIIGRSGKGVLARRVLDHRMIKRAHLYDTSLQPTTPPFLVRTQNFHHFSVNLTSAISF